MAAALGAGGAAAASDEEDGLEDHHALDAYVHRMKRGAIPVSLFRPRRMFNLFFFLTLRSQAHGRDLQGL